MRRWRSLGDKGQLEVIDDAIHHGTVGDEGNDTHFPLASGAGQRINLIDFYRELPQSRRSGKEQSDAAISCHPPRHYGITTLSSFARDDLRPPL